jgi:uncharacterized protein (AIM24 family)
MATFEIVEQEGMRFVKIGIDKETVQAESGALCAMSGDVTMDVKLPSVGRILKSYASEESHIRPTYTGTGTILLESSFGGFHVVDLMGETWILESGSYWASDATLNLSAIREKVWTSLWTGEGVIDWQTKVSGHGTVVVRTQGPVDELNLMRGERYVANGKYVVGRSAEVAYSLRRPPSPSWQPTLQGRDTVGSMTVPVDCWSHPFPTGATACSASARIVNWGTCSPVDPEARQRRKRRRRFPIFETPSLPHVADLAHFPIEPKRCETPSPMGRGWGERLCWLSSGLPWLLVSENGVEDGEEFAGDGNEGDHLGLPSCDQAAEEGLQDGVVSPGGHRSHEEGGAHASSSAADEASALPLAGLAGEGREPGKGCDLLTVEAAEFGQIGDESARNDRPDARHRGEEVLLVAPGRRAAHGIVDVGVDAGEFLLEGLDETRDALLDPRGGPFLALALGADHLDDLPPARNQVCKETRGFIGQRPRLGLGCLGEVGDDGCVDGICLCTLADRLGEGADLGRINDDDRQPCGSQGRSRNRFEASGGFQDDERGSQRLEPLHQQLQATRVAFDNEHLSTGTQGDVETIFGDVDTNDDAVHGDPSLPNRASR